MLVGNEHTEAVRLGRENFERQTVRSPSRWPLADDGRSLGFPPTAPFLTPAAVLTSANGFAKARAIADLRRKHRARVERASLSVNYVVLVRWREMRQ